MAGAGLLAGLAIGLVAGVIYGWLDRDREDNAALAQVAAENRRLRAAVRAADAALADAQAELGGDFAAWEYEMGETA